MRSITLRPRPLTAAAFEPFGSVLETHGHTPRPINEGNTLRYDKLATVQTADPRASIGISLFRAQPRSLPMRIHSMEKHPEGSQSFHPLSGEPYLVLVGETGESLEPEHLHLFMARADQGINYHRNTWHHPLLALNRTCDFLVVDVDSEAPNCDLFFFREDVNIQIPVVE